MTVFIAFTILILLTVTNEQSFAALQAKSRDDWVLDVIGLSFQGILIPLLQMTVVYQLYNILLPSDRSTITIHPLLAFCLSFICVDYIYYWNHRLLHTSWFWHLHKVHHTVTHMEVLGTSRNTIWTSFLIIYLWLHPLVIYLLVNPSWYIAGISLTSALDLWRHSAITPIPTSLFSSWLILPQDHTWHHASQSHACNYGANLKLWDKMHGTYYKCHRLPDSLGINTNLTLTQKLIFPFP